MSRKYFTVKHTIIYTFLISIQSLNLLFSFSGTGGNLEGI